MTESSSKGQEHKYSAALRVISKTHRLSELVELLGEPNSDRSADIGDPMSRVNPDKGTRDFASWVHCSTVPDATSLDQHIDELVAFAEANRVALERLRVDCEIDIRCTIGANPDERSSPREPSFEFEPKLMQRLGELDLLVWFDVYCE